MPSSTWKASTHRPCTPSSSLVAIAKRAELFPHADFAMPLAQGRTHPLLVEETTGWAST